MNNCKAVTNGSTCVPLYAELPEGPPGYRSSHHFFNSRLSEPGQKDQLGTLNFLAPERVRSARNEIVTGHALCLDLEVSTFSQDSSAFGGRPPPIHTCRAPTPFARDDHLSFNTQSSSQWDGLRHFGFRSTTAFYNGYTGEELDNSDALGIHVWAQRGGIAGRGVLVDWWGWRITQGEPPHANSGYAITLAEILQVLHHQQTVIKPGDILLFRTGWVAWYLAEDMTSRHRFMCEANAPGQHTFLGVASERPFVEWLWNNQISAVASDGVAFEATPPPLEFGWLHEHLLAGLGCPIGELWNLEKLAEACRKRSSWSFFLSSVPLHIRGGVASPANASAIL